MFTDNFFKKVQNKTNVDKTTIIDLAQKLQNANMKDENTIRNVIKEISTITNKEVSKLSYKTALVVQALKSLGKDNIDDIVISRLRTLLTDSEKETMLDEAKATTAWIYEFIKSICRG